MLYLLLILCKWADEGFMRGIRAVMIVYIGFEHMCIEKMRPIQGMAILPRRYEYRAALLSRDAGLL